MAVIQDVTITAIDGENITLFWHGRDGKTEAYTPGFKGMLHAMAPMFFNGDETDEELLNKKFTLAMPD